MFDIGGRIKELRVAKGLQQSELADMVGITRESLSRMERNKVSPSIETLERICDALEVSIRQFFNSPESELPPEVRNIAKSVLALNEEQRRTLERFLRAITREVDDSVVNEKKQEQHHEESATVEPNDIVADITEIAAHMESEYGIDDPGFVEHVHNVIRRTLRKYDEMIAKQNREK